MAPFHPPKKCAGIQSMPAYSRNDPFNKSNSAPHCARPLHPCAHRSLGYTCQCAASKITESKPCNGLSVQGSPSNTSIAAPPSCPERRASANACASTTAPRAVLIKYAPFFMQASACASIICRVSSVNGTCSETKSASPSSVFQRRILRAKTPLPPARSCDGCNTGCAYQKRRPGGRLPRRCCPCPRFPAYARPRYGWKCAATAQRDSGTHRRNVPGKFQNISHLQFGHGPFHHACGARHFNPLGLRIAPVHRIDPHAAARNDLQPGRSVDHFPIDLFHIADDAIRFPYNRQDLFRCKNVCP